jgi:DNA polymerase-3 subunit delta'
MIYPWQRTLFAQWIAQRATLPHAVLLSGPRGIGKGDFARHLARSLLCEAPQTDGDACGTCPACGWFDAGNHPDYRAVTLSDGDNDDEEGDESSRKKPPTQIGINQIRALSDFMTTSTHRAGLRVVLIDPADALNTHAANALLKSLEEPLPNTLYLLVCHQPRRLPATVRSRCQHQPMPMPTITQARGWLVGQGVAAPDLPLALCAGAPLEARAMAAENSAARTSFMSALLRADTTLVGLSELAIKIPMVQVVDWLQRFSYDLMEQKFLGQPRFHIDLTKQQLPLATHLDVYDLLAWEKQLRDARRVVNHPLNPRLFAESLLAPWMALRSSAGAY